MNLSKIYYTLISLLGITTNDTKYYGHNSQI